jgi:hypothetical protein
VLAAEPTVVGRGVAAWPPIALILVIEVLARSPLPTGGLRWVAGLGAGAVAVTAGLASFHHMHEVALTAGESQLVAWLFPLTVDGLAVVASVGLLGHESHTDHDGPNDHGEHDSQDGQQDQDFGRSEHGSDRTSDIEVGPLTRPEGVAFPPVLNGAGSHKPSH